MSSFSSHPFSEQLLMSGLVGGMQRVFSAFKTPLGGGDMKQLGGEFVFSNGEPVYVHRMEVCSLSFPFLLPPADRTTATEHSRSRSSRRAAQGGGDFAGRGQEGVLRVGTAEDGSYFNLISYV